MPEHSEEFLRRAAEARSRIHEVAPDEAKRLAADGAVLLDVRGRDEYEAGHIDGAINCRYDRLEDGIEDRIPDKAAPIVAYCGGGKRGAIAADTLQRIGYTNVSSIAGGFSAYCESQDLTED